MGLTFDFIRMFCIGLYYISPLLVTMLLVIVVLGNFLGKLEGWSRLDAIHYAFITATTVGYGDFHPRKKTVKIPGNRNRIYRYYFYRHCCCYCMQAYMRSRKRTSPPRLHGSQPTKAAPYAGHKPASLPYGLVKQGLRHSRCRWFRQ
jgi:hypothetical protein